MQQSHCCAPNSSESVGWEGAAVTRAYVERRTNEGLSKREIIRCLKRYIAREIYANLPRPEPDSQAPTAQDVAA